jgi:5-hydroxyisourate hydrolase
MTLSTHVLDLAHGVPAEGVVIRLFRDGAVIAEGTTNADGRCPSIGEVPVSAGKYALEFAVAPYFSGKGIDLPNPPFIDIVTIAFGMADGGHYHVPLLVSPFGYSTYRGS